MRQIHLLFLFCIYWYCTPVAEKQPDPFYLFDLKRADRRLLDATRNEKSIADSLFLRAYDQIIQTKEKTNTRDLLIQSLRLLPTPQAYFEFGKLLFQQQAYSEADSAFLASAYFGYKPFAEIVLRRLWCHEKMNKTDSIANWITELTKIDYTPVLSLAEKPFFQKYLNSVNIETLRQQLIQKKYQSIESIVKKPSKLAFDALKKSALDTALRGEKMTYWVDFERDQTPEALLLAGNRNTPVRVLKYHESGHYTQVVMPLLLLPSETNITFELSDKLLTLVFESGAQRYYCWLSISAQKWELLGTYAICNDKAARQLIK